MEAYLVVQIFALLFWSFQLAPQAWENHKRQSTEGLSSLMMLFWTFGSLATAIYVIGDNTGGKYSPLFILQPNLFMVFSVTCWTQTVCDQSGNTRIGMWAGLGLTVALLLCDVLGAYYLLQSKDGNAPYVALGSLSLIFFALGFVPQYVQIYTARKVEGISIPFLMIDMTGSILSITSLAMQEHFEPIAGACYIIVFVLDSIIVLLHYLLPLVYKPLAHMSEREEDSSWRI